MLKLREKFLNEKAYNAIIGLLILYGLLMNIFVINIANDFVLPVNPIISIFIFLGIGIIGGIITAKTNNAFISFIGYNLLSLSFGMILSISLRNYSYINILTAMSATAVVTMVMIILSIFFPILFSKLGKILFISLISGILIETAFLLLGINTPILNWLFVVVFSGYIGYDWYKAQNSARTINNAINSALDIYLDIIGLFLHLVKIFEENDTK